MRLISAHVTDFKSINDATRVDVEDGVTCLVGKNESGKTAFLEALYKLNPLEGKATKFDELLEYPRARRNEDRESIPERRPILTVFRLEATDLEALEAKLGKGCLESDLVRVSRTYGDKLYFGFELNQPGIMRYLLASKSLDISQADGCATLREFKAKLASVESPPEPLVGLRAELEKFDPSAIAVAELAQLLPKFLYFDNYSTLPGVFSIPYIQGRQRDQLDRNEITAKALLQLAGVDVSEFTVAEYEKRRAALEAAALQVSRQVFKYWKQNRQLRVYFDSDFQKPKDGDRVPPWLQVRIENLRHGMTLNFDERSTGFVWFFSFFTYFSAYRKSKHKHIILLDEPGLSLHASGQGDLLEMMDQELAANGHQVIYTTHSPFMIRANQLQRARTVEDKDDVGTIISPDVYKNSKETIFPLQAALGYTMAQTLFVGPDNLVVEGPSDIIYLQVVSDLLSQQGRPALSPRWTPVPAGGVEKVPAFISLYGTQLNVAVLLDSSPGANQRVQSMVSQGLLAPNKLVSIAEFTSRSASDVEDMFDEDFYIKLLAASGAAVVDKTKLGPGPRILKRIESQVGRKIDHFRPAMHLLNNQATLLSRIDAQTLDRFEALFKRVNPLLS
jgi:predicted ATPase